MPSFEDLRYQLRDRLEQKPWIKWAALGVAALLVVVLVMQLVKPRSDPGLSGERLAVQLEVRFEDTGDTMKVPVGYVTGDLLKADAGAGEQTRVTNPKSGKRTGVVLDKREWSRIVKDVERLRTQ